MSDTDTDTAANTGISGRLIEFQLIEDGATDHYRDKEVAPHRLLLLSEPIRIDGVAAMVDTVIRLCELNRARIHHLVLVCHGNAGGFWIGKDWLSVARLRLFEADLARLTGWFDRSAPGCGASATIHSCEAGTEPRLLARLAEIWGGIGIAGYLDRYYKEVFKPLEPPGLVTCKLRLRGVVFADQEL